MKDSLNSAGDDRPPLVDERYAHDFDVTTAEARAIQRRLRGHVVIADDFAAPVRVAGLDVGFEGPPRGRSGFMRAAVAVLDAHSLEIVETARVRVPATFPYVPGLLSFREVPALLLALEELSAPPDLLVCDGQGLAHPRRLGIACHLGLLTGIPAIGVAKSRLIGVHEELPEARGSRVPLLDGGEMLGWVLRSRTGVKPLFVSPGHRVGLQSALDLTLGLLGRYRQPETTRAAHRLASGR